MMDTKKVIGWDALEHAYFEKSADWYWIVGIAGVTLAVVSFLFSNTVLGVLLVVATITVMIHGAKQPRVVRVELKDNGVRFGTSFYPFRELLSFSINEEHDPPVLVLDSKALLTPDIQIFIEEVEIEAVRQHLLNHLDEKYYQHKFVDGLIHYLGF
jgi:hypothetical protein